MKHLFCIFLFLCANAAATAQIGKIGENIFGSAQEEQLVQQRSAADSLKIEELTLQIQQLKLNEIMYQNELQRSRNVLIADSVQQVRHKARIDSLRKVTKGVPLVVDNDSLFVFYAGLGGMSTTDRASNVLKRITDLGNNRNVTPDSIFLYPLEGGMQIEIMYRNRLICSVTKNDALWMNTTMDSLAIAYRENIVAVVKDIQHKNSLWQLFKRITLLLLLLGSIIAIFWGINRLYRVGKKHIIKQRNHWFKPITIRNYELLNVARQANIAILTANVLRYVLIFIELAIMIPFMFAIFPQTEDFAHKLLGYITNPIQSIFISVVNYIPNLFTITIIWLCIRYLIKAIAFVAREIESERLKIPGFYTDWAMPTYQIVRFLLYAFMVALIYRYLPGSQTGVFQGVSIFVGLIVSLGSSTVIGNILAGLIITYMRPFKIGDFIKLSDTVGNVIEKTPFVTRIKTTKNEIITIPNSFILSSHTTNYSASARDYGLIIHTSIAVGYEVPWQKAHECLIKAAKRTDGTLKDREPFVLDLGLEDYYNSYQINIYIEDADQMPKILTELHSHIQDVFTEAGIDLESPLLTSARKEPAKHKWNN
ncbi:MAG: mechanosensitive ion channel family protein [Bacteroidales bacterium]|jgi:small-conductance mechanosensitive channel|nr:mechanosensitive ion channel family protein [Bacteroidales bacterium]